MLIKSKLAESMEELKNTPEEITESDKIWKLLIDPDRAIEVKVWLEKNKLTGSLLRGKNGETMLHWAALSEYALIIDLLDYLDINVLDNNKKTPLDWILGRYYYILNNKEEFKEIQSEGIEKIKIQTEHLGTLVLGLGGKPYQLLSPENIKEITNSEHFGVQACFCGAWWLLRELYYLQGANILTNWLDDKRTALHLWFQAPYSSDKNEKYKILVKNFGIDVNVEDANLRTPIWYAIDGFFYSKYILLENPNDKNILESIEALMKLGADPNLIDINDVAPTQIGEKYKEKVQTIIEKLNEYKSLSDLDEQKEKLKELQEFGLNTENVNLESLLEKYNNLFLELDLDIDTINFFMEINYEQRS